MSDDKPAQLAAFRRDMLRFALLQLRDEAAAEDAVQETMVAALESGQQFAQRAQFKTWVFAILKNKIIDHIRRRGRETQLDTEEIPEDGFDPLFDDHGHWKTEEKPATWGDPAKTFENGRFWLVFEACLDRLPANTSRVFMMREFLGFDTDEICKELAISSSNCWVVLHRARMALRLCLEDKWFGKEAPC